MEKQNFKPYVPAEKSALELTATSIVVGLLLAVLFGGANAYLGLRVGMTISASIPAAVISMGVLRVLLKRDSVLENNMVQTIGSAGESLAAGAIFTMPALFMWAKEWGTDAPSFAEIATIAFLGGTLGVLFMVPLRNALIVKEHGVLPYPEGTACSEVLLAGESGGSKATKVFAGLGIAAVYKFIADGLKLFPSEVDWDFKAFKGAGFGMDVLPALLGVGYICGVRISSYLFAGGILAWFVIMPCIAIFGGDTVLFPAKKVISELGTWGIWSSYIRYIGAGALATGGIISLLKALPLIVSTFKKSMQSFSGKAAGVSRLEKDLPMSVVIGGIALLVIAIWLLPVVPVSFLGAVLVVVFGFFFATVSSRMVGLVGSSNNPVSGMTIASMLFTTIIFVATGNTGHEGMIGAIAVGSIVCIVSAMAGDTSQDLKTGYILGATPVKQQIGEIIGVIVSALTIGGVLYLLDAAWGFGSSELAAPQAMLMKMVIEGVMAANLPWNLVFVGAAIAIAVEVLRIPVLPFAIGIYLPIHMTAPLMAGGLLRLWFEKRNYDSEEIKKETCDNGTLFASGLIAGEGLVGILLAVFAVLNMDFSLSAIDLGNFGGVAAFVVLAVIFCLFSKVKKA
jgi:putative OPT family oligopeptide transporter